MIEPSRSPARGISSAPQIQRDMKQLTLFRKLNGEQKLMDNGFVRPFAKSLSYLIRATKAGSLEKAITDQRLKAKYGSNAPLTDMAIFPHPKDVVYSHKPVNGRKFSRRDSGRVIDGDWDLSRADLSNNTKLLSCKMRWLNGADWEETPIFQRMLLEISEGKVPDGCRTPDELYERYTSLDQIYMDARSRGRLLRMAELPTYYRREHGAPLVHVGRDGNCLRSGGGAHRFAIAKILELAEFPAQVGVIHPDAIKNGHLERLRKSIHTEPENHRV